MRLIAGMTRYTALLLLLLIAGRATARCKEPLETPAICAELDRAARAARAPASDPLLAKAERVWARVAGPFAALTGRGTTLAVLAREARFGTGAKPFPPVAYVCAGAPPIVYVPHTLLELVYETGRYPEDFLAFVLGHELGHRAVDLSREGCPLGAFQGGTGDREARADGRSAFLTAIAGFSTRRVASEELVTRFLQGELALRGATTDRRRAALTAALNGFDAWERLYRTGTDLVLAGELDLAQRLLGWADALMRSEGVPLAEIAVARALVLLSQAAPWAPWMARMRLPVNAAHLRCLTISPAHTALWDRSPARKPRGPGSLEDAARALVVEARRLLGQGRALGASRLVLAGAEGCAALYLGDHGAAREAFKTARRLAGAGSGASVASALDANLALVELLAWTEAHPARGDPAWASELRAAAPAFAAHEDASLLVELVADPGARGALAPASRPTCRGSAMARPHPAVFPSRPAGVACPAGFTETARLADAAGTILSCAANALAYTQVRLRDAPVTEVLTEEASTALDAWACSGCRIDRVGATDLGEDASRVTCPGSRAVFVSSRDGTVTTVVSVRMR